MKEHDYTRPRWGHAVSILSAEESGRRLRVEGFGRGVSVGDYLILAILTGEKSSRYAVDEIRYCRDPGDQWFAWIRYVPESA